ncbi:unnamed protein product [Triticum turgidum subsp. durum]|uniref:Subtilisin-like protease n=1 Tax=Triticum turgidum subsp. durum TaxID=4567 RepID=A0A9R0YRG6_TRITD|nr:unnamed protein product [Triticum turgidum subsp. durum]
MPPPPAKWKGRCDFNRSVCNNKLIGARSFYESAKWRWEGIDDPVLPIDDSAHGTHVSSTAVGAFVPGANAMGSGFGTAAGMAPRAHLAFYQVCFVGKGCDRDDILAAIDDALDEGIDVLSMSLGADDAGDFAADPIALGGFSSVMRGVFVCTSAGNQGPSPATVANEAPWLLTVAAATTDRTFSADVNYVSVQQPLVRDTAADGTCSDKTVLTAQHVAGKIVLCISGGNLTNLEKGSILHDAGAIAMIIVLPEDVGSVISPKAHALPATQVEAKWSEKIMAYVNSTQSPTAQLVFRGAVLGNRMAPVVAPFSSRGPSRQNQGILKPDITGPGVNIIAAVPMPNGLAQPPNEMAYKDVNQVQTFTVTIRTKDGQKMKERIAEGQLKWVSRKHVVRSPILVSSKKFFKENSMANNGQRVGDS